MVQCIHHPEYPAIEHCESCHVPLCGQCLWYAESGQRLCERCARAWQEAGHTVLPPEQFAEGIRPTLDPLRYKPQMPSLYSGNNIDLAAFAAACLGGMMLLYCVPCLNVLAPLLGLLLGILALVEAGRAANPNRTRLLAGIGVASGGLVVLGGILWIGFTVLTPIIMLVIDSMTKTP
ncbi:MAG: B-box zinc finger protein [Anaerolineae bacterium]|nr:B-box zinc finger protein [Anaerolineae bacterium]